MIPRVGLAAVASVFAVFSSKKCHRGTLYKNSGSLRFASLFLVFSSVTGLSHRFLRCFRRLSTFCTCQLGLAFVFQLSAGGGGWRDDVHANATCVFCYFCCFLCVSHFASVFTVFCRISTFCTCQLRLAFVFQLCAGVGGGDGGG